MHSNEAWILRAYDALQGCEFNYPAIFGMSFMELPLEIAEDVLALRKRQGQIDAGKH